MDDATGMAELPGLLARAERAGPAHRIEYRDPIAAHGRPAIDAVRPWLDDPKLAAFAIRVIEVVGHHGEQEAATETLRDARRRVDPRVRPDVDWALLHMRPNGVDGASGSRPAAPASPKPRVQARSRRRTA
jgi:hypothetical protein